MGYITTLLFDIIEIINVNNRVQNWQNKLYVVLNPIDITQNWLIVINVRLKIVQKDVNLITDIFQAKTRHGIEGWEGVDGGK